VARILRPIAHDDRLSVVDHLDELRSRLFVCLVALAFAFGICFWQNHALLTVLNRALPHVSTVSGGQHGLAAIPDETAKARAGLLRSAKADAALASSPSFPLAVQHQFALAAQGLTQAASDLPSNAPVKEKPITIGVGEPFTTTLTVAAYFALLFTLPILLYEAYAFMIPALTRSERRAATPAMIAAPLLFVLGAGFAYFVVMPPAVHFLQGYNSDQFDILVQAKSYYTFQIMVMLAIGLAFEIPLALMALHRIGVINGRTLTRNWRYATVIIAIIAAAMPGADPVTTALETAPLVILFLASIVMLKIADRRAAARAAAEMAQMSDGLEVS
jgi:sec-independent protein translocase protein TatC